MSAPSFAPAAAASIFSGGSNPLLSRGSKVDLKLSGYQLRSVGIGVSPCAFAVLYCRDFGRSDWREVTRSETVQDTSPVFQQLFSLDYHFAVYQEVRIVIFDRSTPSNDLTQQRLIGVADSTLGRILSARGSAVELPLTNMQEGPDSTGKVLVAAEAVVADRKRLVMDLAVAQLMTSEEASVQATYLAQMGVAAAAPGPGAPKLARRGVDAARQLMGRFRKDEPKAPGALPAHLENEQHRLEQQHTVAQQQYHAAATSPPPFSPYLIIARGPPHAIAERDPFRANIAWEPVYRSAPLVDVRDLKSTGIFQNVSVTVQDLCDGDENLLLKISVHRSGGTRPDSVVGATVTTLRTLRRLAGGHTTGSTEQMMLEPAGQLSVLRYEEIAEDNFVDYVRSGRCDFSLVCAVDFTESNGPPSLPNTCHYISPPGAPPAPNQYEAAMRAVGNILASYSTSNKVSAFGFGAKVPPKFDVSHCFPVTESVHGTVCDGVDGLVRAYKATLGRVQLAGPTIFSKVLQTAGTITSRAVEQANRSGSHVLPYSILLILTDGVISDYDASVAQLIALSVLPISVIIVGIGGEDFRVMERMAEQKPLRRGTITGTRDMVQFVPFRDFRGDPAALAEAVLTKLPEQVMSYVTKVQARGR